MALPSTVVDNDPELDMDWTMVTTGIDLDPANIITWLMEPYEQVPANENTEREPRDDDINTGKTINRQENCYIGPFKFLRVEHQSVLMYTVDNGVQVWINDGDKKVLGQVKDLEEYCDEVLEQIKETWISSPAIRNNTRRAKQTHDVRPHLGHSGEEIPSSSSLTRTERP